MHTTARVVDMGERLRNSQAYREAERQLDFWAVVLIGTMRRVPRTWSDNEGVWPVRVGLSQHPEDYAGRIDLDAGSIHPHVALEWVWTESKRHATRIKTRLDYLLLGDNDETRLRHGWRSVNDPAVDWPILMQDALRQIEAGGESIEVFDGESRHRRVLERMIADHASRRRGR